MGDGGNGLLPQISNNAVIIDGWSEPDFLGTPVIRIDGAVAPNGAGLSFSNTSDGSTVRGLMITGFQGSGTGDGILVQAGADNITIRRQLDRHHRYRLDRRWERKMTVSICVALLPLSVVPASMMAM